MSKVINNVDFYNLDIQKYWSMPPSWDKNRKRNFIKECIFSNQYIGSVKKDGAFYRFVKYDNGEMELLGRSRSVSGEYINKIGHVPQFNNFFNSLPNGTCILGELYFPDKEGSRYTTTIMGCKEDKAIDRQKEHPLHYYIFDVLSLNGQNLIQTNIENRVIKLKQFESEVLSNKEFSNIPVEFAHYVTGENLWKTYINTLNDGGEGVVITKIGTCYQPGKRKARQTLKLKKELQENIDVVIIGANPPKKEYNGKYIDSWKYWENVMTGEKIKGELYFNYQNGDPIEPVTRTYFYEWAGSLIIGICKNDKIISIGNLGGLTDEILKNWKNYIGKVAEVTCMEILETGGLRHPKFIRWREDLTSKDTDWYRWFNEN